jgi:hypothetical protein
VQRAALERAQAVNLADHLARQLPGVQINDIQGSPYQGDLTFRGRRASGLLGASQGLSVYLDGVRVNEPFGDVVNWELLPEFALRQATVLPEWRDGLDRAVPADQVAAHRAGRGAESAMKAGEPLAPPLECRRTGGRVSACGATPGRR